MRIPYISLAAAGALALGGCAYGDMGFGLGYGDYGSPYYGSGYGSPYYGYGYSSPYYGYGYGSPYFGWYDDFYYPGTGVYVYDSSRRRRVWNDRQRDYWSRRQQSSTTSGVRTRGYRENWSGFNRRSAEKTSGTRPH